MFETYASQLLDRYINRMTLSILRVNSMLAREIEQAEALSSTDDIRFSLSNWKARISGTIQRYGEELFKETALGFLNNVGTKNQQLEFLLNFIRPELRRHGDQQAELIELYLRKRINRLIASGKKIAEVKKAIVKILETKSYAKRIAETEAHTAAERGAWQAASSFGLPVEIEWVTREDGDVRPDHAAVHGQKKFVGEYFIVGGERMRFPGDPRASAKQRANCRCTARYRLKR
jgi:Phage Mu protein F like protein